MIDNEKRRNRLLQKEKVRRRVQVQIDPDNYEFFPAKKQTDYYDNDVPQRVGIYVRVSTDNVQQTTSYELQKKYYEDFVVRHPNWTLVEIYADEGISGTSLRHRDAFNKMIADAKAGLLDMIITKSVSRFSRNVTDCIGIVRDLAELKSPVGVFFESECIFSLNDDSAMALSFQATMAEEESHTRSRSMETSLRMRLDNGLPLTPKLLGYTHDIDGNLIINPEEAPTVKLVFYMYLFGYSTQQIADALNTLERKSYLGNVNWTAGGVSQILRNERHCGDVLTRKTFTPNYRTHLSRKNRGERPQSHYMHHHEGIVSRDDFIAVQRMLANAKYGNKTLLPELSVIHEGILKGFVTINPRWAGFKASDYYQAARSAYIVASEGPQPATNGTASSGIQIKVRPGDFDLRGFEIARTEFFDTTLRPFVTMADRHLKFGTECVRKFGSRSYIEMLVNPIEKKFAIRPTDENNRNGVFFSRPVEGSYAPKDVPGSAYVDTLFEIFGWNTECKYRIIGSLYEKGDEIAYIFDAENSEAFFKPAYLDKNDPESGSSSVSQPLTPLGKRIRAIPEDWTTSFGKQYYLHERTLAELANQSEADWKLHIEGRLFETGNRLNVTSFDDLRSYIRQELSSGTSREVQ